MCGSCRRWTFICAFGITCAYIHLHVIGHLRASERHMPPSGHLDLHGIITGQQNFPAGRMVYLHILDPSGYIICITLHVDLCAYCCCARAPWVHTSMKIQMMLIAPSVDCLKVSVCRLTQTATPPARESAVMWWERAIMGRQRISPGRIGLTCRDIWLTSTNDMPVGCMRR